MISLRKKHYKDADFDIGLCSVEKQEHLDTSD